MQLRHIGFILLLSVGLVGIPLASSYAQVICTGNASPPPELPVYDQPPIPDPGYIWTPGYWSGGPLGYFWVPGTWVEPPSVGLLWTPGYWGFRDGIYVWNAGYWGPHVGFYGGVDYGFGYGGDGYLGGRWVNGAFAYNQTVNNFGSVRINNVYEENVTINNVTRISFNGGPGGTTVRPTPAQEAVAREQHIAADPAQIQHERTAAANKDLLASENHGRPAIAATAKPGEFSGKGVVAAREVKPGEEGLRKPNNAMRPAIIGNKPMEREITPNNAVKPAATGNKPPERDATPNNPTKPVVTGNKPMEREDAPKAKDTVKREVEPSPNNAVKPAVTGNKPAEREETPKAKETVKREVEPNPPTNNAVAPNNNKPPHDQAKLPAETPKLREKPPEVGAGTANPPPKIATVPNANPKAKPDPKDKKPPQ
jgi:hypothetical protein